ncbi:hypothetical protein TRFO_15042 [Tritrichomonas foetus]|uniref:DUF3447 domain-containing protein n=1 Tax=Tritrichomonas foetus TaxID=1144522 RepID=A0A1J4KTA9_9EUKA|nr:hypothetical protein TRFO_15042 [Tritrichomonas foetus]|eukprot:OHT14527.1 hypothetical protein TRFO_15042 [Tritrichomonas foetus]
MPASILDEIHLKAVFKFGFDLDFQSNFQFSFPYNSRMKINGITIRFNKNIVSLYSQKISDFINTKNSGNEIFTVEIDGITKFDIENLNKLFHMKTLEINCFNYENLKKISKELEIELLSHAIQTFEKSLNLNIKTQFLKHFNESEEIQEILEELSQDKINSFDQNLLIDDSRYLDSFVKKHRENLIHYEQNQFFYSTYLFCQAHPLVIRRYLNLIDSLQMTNEFVEYLIMLEQNANKHSNIEECSILAYIFDYGFEGKHNENRQAINIPEENELSLIIRNDDCDKFQNICSSPAFKLNSRIESIGITKIMPNPQENPTLIEYAAFFGSIKIFKYLLIHIDSLPQSLVLYAVSGGNIEILHLCEQHNCSFNDCIKYAVKYRHYDMISWLIETKQCQLDYKYIIKYHANEFIIKFLQEFISKNDKNILSKMLYSSVKYNNYCLTSFLTNFPNTNLNFVSKSGKNSILHRIYPFTSKRIITLLLSRNDIDFDTSNAFGMTPFLCACETNNVYYAKLLYSKSINISHLSYNSYNPLHIACLNLCYETAKYLISLKKININSVCNDNQSPLFVLCQTINSMALLELHKRISPNNSNENIHLISNFIKLFLDNGADVNIASSSLLTPLFLGIENDNHIIFHQLLKSPNANINYYNRNGYSLLIYACKKNNIEAVKLLLEYKNLDINMQNLSGVNTLINNTALHISIIENRVEIVKLLINDIRTNVNKQNTIFISI